MKFSKGEISRAITPEMLRKFQWLNPMRLRGLSQQQIKARLVEHIAQQVNK